MKRKNILITGASSGLGKGMAIEFAKLGCNLALCARRLENLHELKKEIEEINPMSKVFIRSLDVNNWDDVFTVFHAFKSDFRSTGGKLDRVIVNAGMGKGAPLGTGYFKQNIQTAQTNFAAALAQFEAAMEIFREQNDGHLVAISSMSAFRGFRGAMTVYAATKAGLKSLAEGLRVDVANKPIKVSTVFPGYIRTEINEKIRNLPFVISLDKGSRLLVKAIESEKDNSYVPAWPWYLLKKTMPFWTVGMLRKF